VCASDSSWLWAAWNSPQDADTFIKKPKKDLSLDCLIYAEAPSEEMAIKTARKLLAHIKQKATNGL
jgi:hypothetical protein